MPRPTIAAADRRAEGGVPDERLVGDVAGAATWLKDAPTSNGKVATIGYCSGGRQSWLANGTCRSRCGDRLLRRLHRRRGAGGHSRRGRASARLAAVACPARCSACSATTTPTRPLSRSTSSRGLLQGRRQAVRVPPLRRRRPRVLLGRPAVPTGPRRRSTAGRRSGRSSRRTWPAEMCTYQTEMLDGRRAAARARRVAAGHRRQRLRRPPGACDGRPHPQRRPAQPGRRAGRRVALELHPQAARGARGGHPALARRRTCLADRGRWPRLGQPAPQCQPRMASDLAPRRR